jgi:undecaprenyl phosphate N,N'-diacetylbacillosamine 1-phosphate transferase
VLIGQMSLIGPRALPVEYLALMNERQRSRHRVRPGITGWAQVNGRHEINWEKKFELDLYYVSHLSPLLDLKIILKTVGLLASLRKDKSLLEKKFEGGSSSIQ